MTFPFAIGAAGAQLERGAELILSYLATGPNPSIGSQGAIAGDVLVVISLGGGSPTIAGGGSTIAHGNGVFSRTLVSGNLANSISGPNGTYSYFIWRSVAAIQIAVSDPTGGAVTNRSTAGFTKDPKHTGLVGLVSGNTGLVASISLPATFITRQNYDTIAGSQHGLVADRLQPQSPTYASGTPFVWSANGAARLVIIELLTA